ncbi:MAG: type I-C CRISPR-associated protein Cas8c/Csd1, partial [Butyricicoccaceae bacterium]
EMDRGKTKVLVPAYRTVPQTVSRSSGVLANFLCDNSKYILGVDASGNGKRGQECFDVCKKYHCGLLKDAAHPAARAVVHYFEKWNPTQAAEHPLIKPIREELESAVMIFQVGLDYAFEIPEIRALWQKEYDAPDQECTTGYCMVTGQKTEITRLHPSIKGVKGARSSGSKIVSFNKPAFESYEHKQGLNAPVGKYAAAAYGAALNRLLSDSRHVVYIGNSTIVFWAEGAEESYADLFLAGLGNQETIEQATLLDIMRKLAIGQRVIWKDVPLNPDNTFYILGLTSNESRDVVRFFLKDSFGKFSEHLVRHHDRIDIVRPENDPRDSLSVFSLIKEACRPKEKEGKRKTQSTVPMISGEEEKEIEGKDAWLRIADSVLCAILTDGKYPETLYQKVLQRIRAEHEVTRGKAAIIKAYLLKNTPEGAMKDIVSEVAQVKLNEETRYAPYVLGRMFAVLEGIQEAANPGINTTIRDRYFNSACCTPAVVFPVLIRLAQAHLKKMDGGLSAYMNRQLQTLMGMLDEAYPGRLNLSDQGIFQLGYYHQRQKRYEKKEEKNNG